jgi:hypothetical protein
MLLPSVTTELLLCACGRLIGSEPTESPAIPENASVRLKCSFPRAVATSLPAPIASTTARQNASSAEASASTPTCACWRTLAIVADASWRLRSSSVSSHTSANGTK